MEKLNELFQECGFDNQDVLIVSETILSNYKSAKLSKNSDNEIVITVKKGKITQLFLIDNVADVQKIKINDGETMDYKVFYFSEGIDYNKLLK